MTVLAVVAHAPHNQVQWLTLAWIIGAVVVAAVIITVIVLVSRRPKSMEHGIAEFSRSLQAVAPANRAARATSGSHVRPSAGRGTEERTAGAARGETDGV